MVFLIDYENVGSSGLQGTEFLSEEDTVVLFYSSCCAAVQQRYLQPLRERIGRFEKIRLIKTRRNALDMYIAVYIGQLVERGMTGKIAIVSGDRGYESVCEYCGEYVCGELKVVLSPSIEDAILCMDGASGRGRRIAELRRRISIEAETALCIV